MGQPLCSDADFIRLFEQHGGRKLARMLKTDQKSVFERRSRLEQKYRHQIMAPDNTARATRHAIAHPQRARLDIQNGTVIIGSDAHYWPGIVTTAHRAFVKFCSDMQPKAVIKNGDALDGARISRHSPIGWENRPALIDEMEACKERLAEIERAAPNAKKIWSLGNHDGRFETRLATVAPEYARIHGFHLKDHMPYWSPCWSCWINDDVVVKHRLNGGVHATHNNTVKAGKTIVTGHLHSLKVTPFTDYNGTRWGVDCGTLAEPDGPQFVDYTEDGPKNWRSGFVVLTFHKGRLLQPETVMVFDEDHVDFRGKLVRV